MFAGEVGVPRLLKLLDKYGIKTTWFIPGHSLETFPEQLAAVRDAGHEMCEFPDRELTTVLSLTPFCRGLHGYSHEAMACTI